MYRSEKKIPGGNLQQVFFENTRRLKTKTHEGLERTDWLNQDHFMASYASLSTSVVALLMCLLSAPQKLHPPFRAPKALQESALKIDCSRAIFLRSPQQRVVPRQCPGRHVACSHREVAARMGEMLVSPGLPNQKCSYNRWAQPMGRCFRN